MKSGLVTYSVVVVAALVVVQTSALTTFGGTNQPANKTQPAPPPVVRGRECKSDTECSVVPTTRCTRDKRDNKMRCLCVNKDPPFNGACSKFPRALNMSCKGDDECQENAHCGMANNSTKAMTCMCKEGTELEDHACNSQVLLVIPTLMTLFIVSFLTSVV